MFEAAGEAIDRARRGDGPTLIEAKTYRFYGHEEGDAATYRTTEEVDEHRLRDPLIDLRCASDRARARHRRRLRAHDRRPRRTMVDAAYAAGAAAPWPDPSETLDDVYVSYRGE